MYTQNCCKRYGKCGMRTGHSAGIYKLFKINTFINNQVMYKFYTLGYKP